MHRDLRMEWVELKWVGIAARGSEGEKCTTLLDVIRSDGPPSYTVDMGYSKSTLCVLTIPAESSRYR